MTRFNLSAALLFAAGLLSSGDSAWAQATQPPPPAVPVQKVDATSLSGGGGQTIEGTAQAVDGDEIVVGDKLVKLYGIAAPDMTANLGPDARVALDALVSGQRVSCQALDRDQNGNAIAQCKLGTDDIAAKMLGQGLAAVYRVSQNPSPAEKELAGAYDAAEADARTQGVGLWLKKSVEPVKTEEEKPKEFPVAIPDLVGLAGRIGGALIIAIAILVAASSLRKSTARDEKRAADAAAAEAKSLAAVLASEIVAIQASAEEQYRQTASLIQDLPSPGGQLAQIGLPPATVFNSNTDRLHTLPREVSVDLVQFYAQHANTMRIIAQAASLKAETLRAALKTLADAAEQPIKQAAKVLD